MPAPLSPSFHLWKAAPLSFPSVCPACAPVPCFTLAHEVDTTLADRMEVCCPHQKAGHCWSFMGLWRPLRGESSYAPPPPGRVLCYLTPHDVRAHMYCMAPVSFGPVSVCVLELGCRFWALLGWQPGCQGRGFCLPPREGTGQEMWLRSSCVMCECVCVCLKRVACVFLGS